ncbi:MAG: NUDIX hydrolase [Anaerolineales bacterium]|nr:NUDIX hydrolase [Anaerolineales bacterium]
MNNTIPQWLDWAREIQALAQSGENYALNEWQSQRYQRLMEIAAEIVSAHTALPASELVESFRMQRGYATPKVDVRGAVFRDGKLLLVHEKMDGGWTMPGGWADVGDSPAAGAEREVWEESGFRVRARKLVGVYDANRVEPLGLYHAVKLVFLCEILSGEATPSNETSAVAFFDRNEIPGVLSGQRTRPRHIQDAFAALENPTWQAVFD